MNHQECLKHLESIQNLGIKFGLDNVQEILSAFRDPHLKYPSVLVAGSNGKGSVCAMLARILSLHGLRAGLFSSPHLVDVEERIRVGENIIPRSTFCRLLTKLREKIDQLVAEKKLLTPPTYFEHLCCLAFLYFEEEQVDMALLEVGMGGRFDATNVVYPLVSVITTISAEHQKFLGKSLDQIASEKAGIIKTGIPVVCGVRDKEAYQTIRKRAEELGSPFFGIYDQKGSFSKKKTEKGFDFRFRMDGETYEYKPFLQGEHQGRNAALAIAASRVLSQRWKKLAKAKIIRGIRTARWEGRLEIISKHPLILLDGAHNEEGAIALKKHVKDFIDPPVVLVFAAMRDKKIDKIANLLFPLAEKVILTSFPYFRAATPEELWEKTFRYRDRTICEPDVERAYRLAQDFAGPSGRILITGSLFLVGEIKKFQKQAAEHIL